MPQPALPFDVAYDLPSGASLLDGPPQLPKPGGELPAAPCTLNAPSPQHPAPSTLNALSPQHPAPSTLNAPSPSPVFVRHPQAKRYVVRVKLDGSVRVTIPRWGTKREAMTFLGKQQSWIDKQQQRMERERAAPKLELPAEELRHLRSRALRELPQRLLALAEDLELVVVKVTIRNQRWRWGSCSRRGHICLNWRLIAMPEWVRDYVLLHELMHLKRMDHSPKFWTLVAAVCPGFKEARVWLRAHQGLLDSQT